MTTPEPAPPPAGGAESVAAVAPWMETLTPRMETMTTKSRFASGFSIVRNRIEADLGGGVTAVACLEHDSVATPDEFDCYTARDIREFNAGDWYYGTVTLKVAVNGTTVGRYLAAIGAVEIRPDRGDGFDAAVEAAEELLEECPVAKIVGDFAKKATAAALAMKKAK